MSELRKAVIVGSGLTGATCAHQLASRGFEVEVFESGSRSGGHVLNEWMNGIPFEPNGAHIFHTNDDAVWNLASSLVAFWPYEHRVQSEIDGQLFSWPPQRSELKALDEWSKIVHELDGLPPEPDATNFETWTVSLMGRTLYEMFVQDYTRKQWGRSPHELDASIGPKRVELRDDGHLGLFRDRHQGWPAGGYSNLTDALLRNCRVHLGQRISASDLENLCAPGVPIVVTAPLDDFFDLARGPLEWRGVSFETSWIPDVSFAQPVSVVNRPSLNVPWTRTIETKHVLPESDALRSAVGTVVSKELPGADARHYPVPDADGMNRKLWLTYRQVADAYTRNPLITAGRLANYTYINMDESMRQGLEAAAVLDPALR